MAKLTRKVFITLLAVVMVVSAVFVTAFADDFQLSTSGFVTAIDDCYDYVVTRANDAYYQTPEWLRETFERAGWEMYVLDDTAQYGYPIVAGLTVYTEQRIYIANMADAATVKTVEHELGHFLDQYLCLEYGYNNYDACCTFSTEFHEIYYEESPVFVEHYNYPHAGDGFSDFWAECFYEYLNNPYELQSVCPRAFKYMNDIISDYNGIDPFEGHPYNGLYNVDGKLTYYTEGIVDKTFTGFATCQDNNEKYYVSNGSVSKRNDIIEDGNTGNWYYIIDGKVQSKYTGVSNISNDYGWWYIKNGKVDFNKTSIEPNDYGWWRIVNGKVDFTCNSIEQNDYGWWYVTGGKVDFGYTGVGNYCNDYGWWYINNGQVDFSKTSIEPNNYGWWRVLNGKVDFTYNSVEQNDYGWWLLENGKVNFSANTVAQNQYGWWYINSGKVNFGYTGVSNYANPYGWWYIRNGQVDFSFTGYAKNSYGKWYCVNGKVDFSRAV